MDLLRSLELFAGIGGNSIGLDGYTKVVAYCENDRHAQSVLLSRMAEGKLNPAPIWDDVSTLDGKQLKGQIDIIVGGFPCQNISCAGKGEGLDGDRSGLFFEIVRLAEEIQPSFLFLENVPAIRTRRLDRVIQELTKIGYNCRWTMLSAADVGAQHKRERWFLLAHSNGQGLQISESKRPFQANQEPPVVTYSQISDTDGVRMERSRSKFQTARFNERFADDGRIIEPALVRGFHGIPQRVERIKRLGNSVVPDQARQAFEELMGLKNV